VSPFARRIRRCVSTAGVLGLAAAVLGMFPGMRTAYGQTLPSGGWPMVGMVSPVLLYGAWLWGSPTRTKALFWSLASFLCCGGWLISALFRQADIAHISMWTYHATWTLFGAMLAIAGPLATLVAIRGERGEATGDEPSARLVR
jgi:hypothetical protein